MDKVQNAQIRELAEIIVGNRIKLNVNLDSVVTLSKEFEEEFNATAKLVNELSDGKVQLLLKDGQDGGFPYVVKGAAWYCERLDQSGDSRKVIISDSDVQFV